MLAERYDTNCVVVIAVLNTAESVVHVMHFPFAAIKNDRHTAPRSHEQRLQFRIASRSLVTTLRDKRNEDPFFE